MKFELRFFIESTLSIDIETFSSADLSKCGVYKYAEAPDFEILLFGYSADGAPVQVVDLATGETIPDEVVAALTDDTVIKCAFNAQFERICLSRWLRDHGGFDNTGYSIPEDTLGNYLNPASWHCTMIWSAYMGLPLSLEGVGAVLGLDKQKLTEGKDLIRYFCQPCAPTKANGGRTRNRPEDAPEKWTAFKRYNVRDVEVEMSIQAKLAKFPVPESVWEEYHIDQEINDRGVALDMDLVHQAIEMDTRSRQGLLAGMKRLTALENPNSVQQMKQWLSENGLELDSLGKKNVAEAIKTAPPDQREVLLLRQQLAKSSVKKYQAMEKAVCADGRARGMFQFYGANRTGRWAGRIIQMQNLPQKHLPDLTDARSLVRNGDFEAVEMLYEDVPDTLSQLIRTAFVPKSGCKFIVADFSAIEARVLACFSQMIVCGECGEQFRRIHWNNRGCKSIVWRCVSRLEPTGHECHARTVNELELQRVVVAALNELLGDWEGCQRQLQQNIAAIIHASATASTDAIDEKLLALQQELLKKANNKEAYDEIADEIFRLRELKQQTTVDTVARDEQIKRITALQDFIRSQPTELTEFDETLVRRWFKQITVYEDHYSVELKSGLILVFD